MIKEAIIAVVAGHQLNMEESIAVMEEIMDDKVTPAQFGAFVTALRIKGETIDEIAGMAQTMRAKALPVTVDGPLVDTCGTGGDSSATFNISTTAAFVVAGAGLKVAKHGNRAMSSQSGSADVLEALGVKLELNPGQVEKCLKEVGMGFMFAQVFHPSMKNAAGPRREIGIRTVFNILGPLTNPAKAQSQVLGVADGTIVEKIAEVLKRLGCRHALVVHGEDGLDEITIARETRVGELKEGDIKYYSISPENFGLDRADLDSLKGGTAKDNAVILRNILAGEKGARRDVVLLNTAAALIAGDRVENLQQGIDLARESIDHGKALKKMDQLIKFTQKLDTESA